MEYKEAFGSYPPALTFSLAALIAFYRTDKANDGEEIMRFMKDAEVADILKRVDYWGQDLTGMLDIVQNYYDMIERDGMKQAYHYVLNEVEAADAG